MNSLLGEKEEMEEEKKIIVLRIVSLLLQSIGEEGNGSSLGSAFFVTVRHHKKAYISRQVDTCPL